MLELFKYNFLAAFAICGILYVIGEWVSTATKAWIPSVFVTACLMLFGYWYVLPHDIVADSSLRGLGLLSIFLLIVHMGSMFNFKQLAEQWKVVVVCIVGLVGMCFGGYYICSLFMDRSFVIAGLPPLTGGIVAASMMSQAAESASKAATDPALAATLKAAGVYAIAMYCVQGFVGYPLTSVFLQNEGLRLITDFRSNPVQQETAAAVAGPAQEKRKLIPALPAKYDSLVVVLMKMGIVAYLASVLGTVAFPVVGKINGAIWALLLGVLFTAIGFLDKNCITKANSYGILMFALMMYIFDGLKDCTPEMLKTIIAPLAGLIVVGVTCQLVFTFAAAKVVKLSVPLAMSVSLTALYGFPPNAVITESVCRAIAKDDKEYDYLSGIMMPAMIVGGFVTVTISSVVIAGLFVNMF